MTEPAVEAVEAAINQITTRINAAPIDPIPCDNIYMEDVFPADIYRDILKHLPNDSALDFLDHPDAVMPDGRRTRKVLDLRYKSLARLEGPGRKFWAAMLKVFGSERLLASLVDKFRRTLEGRFRGNLPDMRALALLYRDYPGYRIGIHSDIPGKLLTLQFYLPTDKSQVHLGTTFHRKRDGVFEDVKTNAFAPNCAYAFVRTDESWHSVKELGPDERIRNSIALTVYVRGQEYRSVQGVTYI